MKHVSTILFALLLGSELLAQQSLPAVPDSARIDLRLERASFHMGKDARASETAVNFLMVGGAIAAAVAATDTPEHGAMVVAGAFVGYYAFTLKAVSHRKKAARALHGQ